MLRTVCTKNKLHCPNGGNRGIGQHILYISHAMITGLKIGISLCESLCVSAGTQYMLVARDHPHNPDNSSAAGVNKTTFPPLLQHLSFPLFSLSCTLLLSQEKKTCFRRCQAINIVMRAVVLRPDILHAHQHKSNDYYPRAL